MKNKPNIVLITAHDTGRHLGCYGIPQLHTPHLDAMAADGVKFDNFFCTSPVCCPSRATMMTGLYPQTNGVLGLIFSPFNWGFKPGIQHLSKLLQDRGYHTALFHHQHEVMPDKVVEQLSFNEYLMPQDNGFTHLQIAQCFADYVAGYDKDKPFFAQIGLGLTHRVWKSEEAPPDNSKGVFVPPYIEDNDAAREDLSALQGSVKAMDEVCGIMLDAVNNSPAGKNTIVVFTVDHGIELPRAKWTMFDAGLEVALIIRWPDGRIQGGKCAKQLLSNVDLTPTLLELIGEPAPAYMEGKSFAAVCRDPVNCSGRDAVFAEYVQGLSPEARCVRTEKYKLIRNFSDHRLLKVPVDMVKPAVLFDRTNSERDNSFCPVVQLYDLKKDPLETINVAGNPEYAAVQEDLDGKLWQWLEEVKDPILDGPLQVAAYKESIAKYKERRRIQ